MPKHSILNEVNFSYVAGMLLERATVNCVLSVLGLVCHVLTRQGGEAL